MIQEILAVTVLHQNVHPLLGAMGMCKGIGKNTPPPLTNTRCRWMRQANAHACWVSCGRREYSVMKFRLLEDAGRRESGPGGGVGLRGGARGSREGSDSGDISE